MSLPPPSFPPPGPVSPGGPGGPVPGGPPPPPGWERAGVPPPPPAAAPPAAPPRPAPRPVAEEAGAQTVADYTCPYCRMHSDAASLSCPHCGAPVDVRERVSVSGWEEQPPIRDMAKIQFGQSSCQVSGAFVPAVEMRLAAGDGVFFSHHVLLWTDPYTQLGNMPLAGGWNRTMAGLPLVMMNATGPGNLAFSDDRPGETIAVPLQAGWAVDVREHRFLVATMNIGYQWGQSDVWYVTGSGDDRETHYPVGMYVDRFYAQGAPGLLLLHSPGNTFLRTLAPGETILVQPGAFLYKDPTVGMALHLERPGSAGMSWGRWQPRTPWLRMWGPGRIAVASVFEPAEGAGYISSHSQATTIDWSYT